MTACAACGTENPDEARFCASCGASLAVAGRDVRKTVTVLFCDVAGSTALGERLDPEATRRLLGRYFEEVRPLIERHGGTVEKFVGDAVMAVFGLPAAHEDDALRAVRAAVEMRDALARLNDDTGSRLETRTGVNTGEVVAGEGPTLVTGDAVNVAARLEQAAPPGEILIGATTHALVRDAVEATPVDALELKGKAEPFSAWRVERVIEGAPAVARRLDAPLVGRKRELEQLLVEFAHASEERACRLVTIVGEAGLGKSRLSRELRDAVGDEATVLVGRCLPYGEGITYWPLVEIVRAATGGRAVVDLLAGRDDADWISERVASVVGGAEVPTASDEIALAVRKLLEHLARGRPLIVEIDDVQWGESRLLDLLETVSLLARDAPILLVCLARPEHLDHRPGWPGTRLQLEPLSADESGRLLAGLDPLPDDARARIAETAAGNPLFLEQMTALAAQAGNGTTLALPPSIDALLAARLDRLEAHERAAIESASVVGQEFWSGAVRELSPAGSQVGSALLGLVRRQLIEPSESVFEDEDGFRFVHLLVRDAAYRAMPKELRAALHERFAGWVEAKDRARGSTYDEIVGYHLEQAFRYREEVGLLDEPSRALRERAAERLRRAGDRAYARADMPAAASLLLRASALLEEGDRRRVDLSGNLVGALFELGDFAAVREVLADARGVAERLADPGLLAHVRLGEAWEDLTSSRIDLPRARRELNELIGIFEAAGDDGGLAEGWFLISTCDWLESRAAVAEEACEQALEFARKAGDRWLEMEITTQILIAISHGPTPVEEGLRRCRALVEAARGVPTVEAAVLRAQGRLHAMQGDFPLARSEMVRGVEIIAELGLRVHAESSRGQGVAFVESLAGDLEAAENALRASYQALDEMGETGFLSTTAAVLGTILAERGQADEALRLADKSRELSAGGDVASQIGWRWARGRALARTGELDEAERLLREATDLSERTDFANLRADSHSYLAETLWLGGRSDEAAAALRRAIELYDAKGNVVQAARMQALLDGLSAQQLAQRD
jgi:class 3 adenylate cyclase/tetratricopeptide (TPR) repeat protein